MDNPEGFVMLVRDILKLKSADIYSVSPRSSVKEAVSTLITLDVGSLLVLEEGRLIGIMTQRDVLRALADTQFELGDVVVANYMTKAPITVDPDTTVDYVRGLMTENHFSHLPVLEGEKLLGIVSFHDVARTCLKAVHFENALLKRYIKNWPEDES